MERDRGSHPSFLGQDNVAELERAQASSEKCPCGCASFDFEIDGSPARTGGMNILADFLIEDGDFVGGVYIWAQNNVLRGVDVFGYTGDAPKVLAATESLIPIRPIPTTGLISVTSPLPPTGSQSPRPAGCRILPWVQRRLRQSGQRSPSPLSRGRRRSSRAGRERPPDNSGRCCPRR